MGKNVNEGKRLAKEWAEVILNGEEFIETSLGEKQLRDVYLMLLGGNPKAAKAIMNEKEAIETSRGKFNLVDILDIMDDIESMSDFVGEKKEKDYGFDYT